jgi:hypothetical protein
MARTNLEIVTNKGFYSDNFLKMWLLILSSQALGAGGAMGAIARDEAPQRGAQSRE